MRARFTLTVPARPLQEAKALVEEMDDHATIDALAITINETDEARALWNTVAYFDDEASAYHARDVLGLKGAVVAAVPDVDWVRQSLAGLAPVSAGRFYLHGSHDRSKRRYGGHAFEIDAGTAFGTGHHATTAGCLVIFDALLKRASPQRVFDLGCGTGVLAIAAARSLRRRVLATDIDDEAVRVTKRNAACNNLGPLVRAVTAAGLDHPAIRNDAPYDLIFANILARPLVALAHGLCQLTSPGGTIILSGITIDQLRWVSAAYTARGLVTFHVVRNNGWVALAMQKPVSMTKRRKPCFRRLQGSAKAPGWERDM